MKINGSSNRTFMELKYVSIIQNRNTTVGSNRTFMELKSYHNHIAFALASSNRTFMELKFIEKIILNIIIRF